MRFQRCFLALALLGLTACQSHPPAGAATIRLHLPANPASPETRRLAVALRTPAISLQVDSFPILTESYLEHAELVGEGDNFSIRLTFNAHGTFVLEHASLNNRDQLLVIFINGSPVAAPQLKQRISDGVFQFTPDMAREDAEKVVKGLNMSVAYLKKKPF